MKIEIKRWDNGVIIWSGEYDTIKDAVKDAVSKKANLRSADLRYADLRYANLSSADLRYADLRYANLDLKWSFLSISPIGSENGCLWVMKDGKGILKWNRGCFCGTEKEFIRAVKGKHKGNKYEKIYLEAVKFIKSTLKNRERE